jgi:uncharacterized membrane protein
LEQAFIAALPAFLASIVEFVEAFTIVLVVGITRSWKASLWGAALALGLLGGVTGVFGVAIVSHVDRHQFQVVVGTLLLLFGLRWIKKAILRYAGLVGLHDEEAAFAKERAELEAAPEDTRGFDWFAFFTSFKATGLEGLEVAFIVIALGARGRSELHSAELGAVLALVVVCCMGAVVRHPLSKVPENTLKYTVGAMLVSFGIFWSAEGFGFDWPGDAASLIPLVAATAVASAIAVALLRRSVIGQAAAAGAVAPATTGAVH